VRTEESSVDKVSLLQLQMVLFAIDEQSQQDEFKEVVESA
jgi:hypothetical protein